MNSTHNQDSTVASLKATYLAYGEDNVQIFSEQYDILSDHFDVEAIHEARVRLKRLRNFLQWISRLSNGEFKHKPTFKPFRRIFKRIGKIRDAQVQKETLQPFIELATEDARHLESNLLDHEEYFIRQFREGSTELTRPSREDFKQHLEEVIDKLGLSDHTLNVKDFYEERLASVASLSIITDEDEIHSVRRAVKEWYYFLEMHEAHEDIIILSPVPAPKVKALGSLLGMWHDLVVLRNTASKVFGEKLSQLPIFIDEAGESKLAEIRKAAEAMLKKVADQRM